MDDDVRDGERLFVLKIVVAVVVVEDDGLDEDGRKWFT